jgi:type IV pilus assembly protein PilC
MKTIKNRRPLILRFTTKQQAIVAKRLSLYLNSGIPISRAITYISEDSSSPSAAYILLALRRTVSDGRPLSQGMKEFPKCFSSFSIGFIQAGEYSGKLSNTLEQLATFLTKRSAVRTKIYSALTYPIIILVGTLAITLFLTLVIFPKIVPILKGFKTKLPITTRILIWLNAFISHQWLAIILTIGVFVAAIAVSLRSKKMRLLYESIFLRIPIISHVFTYYAIATFCRTLSLQLESGIGILPALSLARTAMPGSTYPNAIANVEEIISNGRSITGALRRHKKLFPNLVCQMVAAGEATGTLSKNLDSLALLYEEQLDELTKNLTVLIEPVLMVCMGLLVGFVALAIITPVYSVTQNLSGVIAH